MKKNIFKITIFTILLLSLLNITNSKIITTSNKQFKNPNDNNLGTIETSELKNGIFTVTIRNVASNIKYIEVPTWTIKNGQDDLKVYKAEPKKGEIGVFETQIYIKNHNYEKGNYNIHAYVKNENHKDIGCITTTKNITSINPGIIQSNQINNEKIKITLNNTDFYQDKIRFAIWPANTKVENAKWYVANRDNNGNVTYDVPIKDHKAFGTYNIHIYAYDPNEKHTFVTSGKFEVNGPQIESSNYSDYNDKTFKIKLKLKNGEQITKINLPTWSDMGGQDDLIEYHAKNLGAGNWEVTVDLSKHYYRKGKYITHIYATTSLGFEYFAGQITSQIGDYNNFTVNATNETSFDINFGDYTKYKGYNLQFVVWSSANGQDDMHTYTTTNGKVHGQYANHINFKNGIDSGTYNIHVYAMKGNQGHIITTKTFTATNPKVSRVEFTNRRNGMIDVIVKDVPSNITSVEVPVWPKSSGTSKAKWYKLKKQSDGTYKETIHFKDHQYKSEHYDAHLYLHKGSKLSITGTGGFDVGINKGNLSAVPNDTDTEINLSLSNSDYIESNITFKVWSEAKGKDDLQKYNSTISKDPMTSTVDIRKHKTAGKYFVEAYYGNTLLASTSTTRPISDITADVQAIQKEIIDLTNANNNGVYKLKIMSSLIHSNSGISKIDAPTWSKSNHSDLYEYHASQTGDHWETTINPKNHKYNTGNYQTDIYIHAKNGIEKCISIAPTTISSLKIGAKTLGQTKGDYKIEIYNTSPETSKVNVPTWSNQNGQDDMKEYHASQQNDGSYLAKIKVPDHYPFGNTTSHIYPTVNGKELNPKDVTNGTPTYNISRYQYMPARYSQKDQRWGYTIFGLKNMRESGCMPTALAMAIAAITGNDSITPPKVASFLYNNGNYNQAINHLGSNGQSVKAAADHYSVAYQGLYSLADVKKALQSGKLVIAAVRHSSYPNFVNAGYTHAIVLYGYNSNGTTGVVDPNDGKSDGTYSINSIYSIPSTDADDLNAGTAFHALY